MDYVGSSRERAGGLILFWKDSIRVKITSHSNNHIGGSVEDEGDNQEWNFIGLYGFLEEHNKMRTWKSLVDSIELRNSFHGEGKLLRCVA